MLKEYPVTSDALDKPRWFRDPPKVDLLVWFGANGHPSHFEISYHASGVAVVYSLSKSGRMSMFKDDSLVKTGRRSDLLKRIKTPLLIEALISHLSDHSINVDREPIEFVVSHLTKLRLDLTAKR